MGYFLRHFYNPCQLIISIFLSLANELFSICSFLFFSYAVTKETTFYSFDVMQLLPDMDNWGSSTAGFIPWSSRPD
jgi:hypothetical protein